MGGLIPTVMKQSAMQRSDRPGDHLTLEEMRLDLCARVGPYRIHAGQSKFFRIYEGTTTQVTTAKGQNKVPSFVRIELAHGYGSIDLELSLNNASVTKYTETFANYIDLILMSHELLFITPHNIPEADHYTEIKVTEILV